MKKKWVGLLFAMMITAGSLAGCGEQTDGISRPRDPLSGQSGNQEGENKDGEDKDVKSDTDSGSSEGKDSNTEENSNAEANNNAGGSSVAVDGFCVVHDVEGLLMAIEPGAKIIMEPGEYNLSDYLQAQWDNADAGWEKIRAKGYVWMEKVFDGVQLHFDNVDGLSIIGRSNDRSETLIVTDPRYASLFTFHDSKEVLLSNLTMGHTDRGECVGNVLDFEACSDVMLVNMDLFGCGVYGVGTISDMAKSCGSFHFYDTTIRDCYYGPLSLEARNTADWYFYRCELSGSDGGGYVSLNPAVKYYFYDCIFGDRESEIFAFRDDFITVNCIWGNIQTYPDYSDSGYYEEGYEPDYEGPEIHKDRIKVVPFDAAVLKDSTWEGFDIMDEKQGSSCWRPVRISFAADGSATISEMGTVVKELDYVCDGHYSAELFDKVGDHWGGVTLYNDPQLNEHMYMVITTENGGEWYYR